MPSVSSASWERHGEPDTERGGVRRMRFGFVVVRDSIIEPTPPWHQAYVASFPWFWPLKDYHGDIRIVEDATGCRIVWSVTCASRIPGRPTGVVMSNLESTYAHLTAALARESER